MLGHCDRHGSYAGIECHKCRVLESLEESERNNENRWTRSEDARRQSAEDERWAHADAAAAAAVRDELADDRRRAEADEAAEHLESIRDSIENAAASQVQAITEAAAKKDDLLAAEILKKARALVNAGLDDDAVPLFERARGLVPTDADLRLDLAETLVRLGRVAAAEVQVEAAFKLVVASRRAPTARLLQALLQCKGAQASDMIRQLCVEDRHLHRLTRIAGYEQLDVGLVASARAAAEREGEREVRKVAALAAEREAQEATAAATRLQEDKRRAAIRDAVKALPPELLSEREQLRRGFTEARDVALVDEYVVLKSVFLHVAEAHFSKKPGGGAELRIEFPHGASLRKFSSGLAVECVAGEVTTLESPFSQPSQGGSAFDEALEKHNATAANARRDAEAKAAGERAQREERAAKERAYEERRRADAEATSKQAALLDTQRHAERAAAELRVARAALLERASPIGFAALAVLFGVAVDANVVGTAIYGALGFGLGAIIGRLASSLSGPRTWPWAPAMAICAGLALVAGAYIYHRVSSGSRATKAGVPAPCAGSSSCR